jgi:hypothetical protein
LPSTGGFVPSAACEAAARIESADAWTPTSAASTPEARIGVEPMFVSATRASSMTPASVRTVTATATIDHAWATRLNFS